jgi:hypothetical protein
MTQEDFECGRPLSGWPRPAAHRAIRRCLSAVPLGSPVLRNATDATWPGEGRASRPHRPPVVVRKGRVGYRETWRERGVRTPHRRVSPRPYREANAPACGSGEFVVGDVRLAPDALRFEYRAGAVVLYSVAGVFGGVDVFLLELV